MAPACYARESGILSAHAHAQIVVDCHEAEAPTAAAAQQQAAQRRAAGGECLEYTAWGLGGGSWAGALWEGASSKPELQSQQIADCRFCER